MARQPRLEIPGGFYHIINRGIERRRIFNKPKDYQLFIKKLSVLMEDEGHKCYAWVLMPNHYHLLLERGVRPLSRLMNRLQTSYAGYYNRSYKRSGHFFQNRYKSVLCDKEDYFMELIAYLHLNPLRAGMVGSVQALEEYPWSSHRVLLGMDERKWQVVDEVLLRFGKRARQARSRYIQYLSDRINIKQDLSGGGLIRSGGSLKIVLARKKEEREGYDSQILGNGEFVAQVAKQHEKHLEIEEKTKPLNEIAFVKLVSQLLDVTGEELKHQGRSTRRVAQARALTIYIGATYYQTKGIQWTDHFQISSAAISKLYKLGEQVAKEKKALVREIIKLNS